ncbi:MAG TPA: hypothetical protein VD993_20100 [Chitinophagaceae bacterium]|nr:hypothetical protein [Chitinophagaceae bacterium]
MKKWFFLSAALALLVACNSENTPDVSDIDIKLETQRFEQDFFAIDTNNVNASLIQLEKKYPNFLNDFLINILGVPLLQGGDSGTNLVVRRFIADYRAIKENADKEFKSFDKVESEVRRGLQFVKHYFPGYPLPAKLITFIGPLDAYYEPSVGGLHGDVITSDALGIGLQLHMGKDFAVYHTELGQRLYPSYISRRFEAGYIPVNCMKNIVDDMFPDNSADKPLIDQIVEKGKRMYLLDKLLPHIADTLKIGYTTKQLEGCYENEGNIWNFFLRNNLLFSIDPALTKNYIQDGPKTDELGEGAPGYIGLFVGWRIVEKYMEKNSDLSLQQLMQTEPRKIFEESKYKPK